MSRTTMPAWYGVGYAMERWSKDHPERLRQLRRMKKHWPFFAAMISNLQMSLFKSDMRIALEYSKLLDNRKLAEKIYRLIKQENKRSIDSVLQIAGVKTLLAGDSVLRLSLSRRDPYLDPLAYLQIDLLKKYRDESQNEEDRMQWQAALLSSINGIAAGLRNTG
jgi:phosphoenolpyruvate carboxylase